MSQVVGIDLGTTNSAIAFMEGDRPEVIVAVQEAPRWARPMRSSKIRKSEPNTTATAPPGTRCRRKG
jgi:molecular chaperone DnaK (HSP70)